MIEEGGVKDVLAQFGVTLEKTRTKILHELHPNTSPERMVTSSTALSPILQEITSNAIHYWERRRVVYNVVLAVIVIVVFLQGLPIPWESMSGESILELFVLAVAANVVFCSAYLPDFIAQLSVYGTAWRRYRWMLFVIGLTLAGIITRWMVMSVFGIHHG